MSLGGYKFRGYKFILPSDYDATVDEQVIAQALRLHKCKLKAFMSACAATNADWQFYETNGDTSFETYGNVIYKLDTDGFNYASFFRYGSDDAYYCMLTISNGSLGTDVVNYYWGYENSTSNHTQLTNNMDSIGTEPITFANVNSGPMYHRLTFFSQDSNGMDSAAYGNSLSKSVSSRYCGYAIKGKNIISIFTTGPTASYIVKISSIGSLKLSSPNDNSNMFSVCVSTGDFTGITQTQYASYVNNIQVSGRNGFPYENSAHSSGTSRYVFFNLPQKAMIINPGTNIPYENAIISAQMRRKSGSILNVDGISSKGAVDIDLIALNCFAKSTIGADSKQICANGNYFCVRNIVVSGANYYFCNSSLYIGWDPSNPDLSQESSWIEYP
jgi:hypothetical protein